MSLLRNVVLEPSSHTNTKSVFRIPSGGKLIMPDLRLCNFGVVTSGNSSGTETYCYGQGIYALVKAVRLYSNNVLIDQCQDCSLYAVLKNLNSSTAYCYDVHQRTLCSNVNMQDEYFAGVTSFKPILNKLLGRLDLSDLLGFLGSTPMLYNMPELRVEIEYNTDVEMIFSTDGNSRDPGFRFVVQAPTMLYTQEMNDEKVKTVSAEMPKSFAWFAWEREFVQGMANGVLNVPRVRAFDSKMVSKLVVQKLWSANNPRLGLGRSDCMGGEKINYIVNGSKQLMFNGHDISARRCAQVSDLMGPLVTPFNAWDLVCANGDTAMLEPLTQINGSLSWDAISLGRVINRLDIEYYYDDNRVAENESVDLWVWGSVLKFANITKTGQLVVGYQSTGASM